MKINNCFVVSAILIINLVCTHNALAGWLDSLQSPHSTCLNNKLTVYAPTEVIEYSNINGTLIENRIKDSTVYYNPDIKKVYIKTIPSGKTNAGTYFFYLDDSKANIIDGIANEFKNYYAELCANGYKNIDTKYGLIRLHRHHFELPKHGYFYVTSKEYKSIVYKYLPMLDTSPMDALEILKDKNKMDALEAEIRKYLESIALEDRLKEQQLNNQKEQRQLEITNERILIMPLPNYEFSDSFISIKYDGNKNFLSITNKTTDFVTVNSISTYYNDKINTIKNINKEYPPESTDENGIPKHSLFSKEMEKTGEYVYKNREEVKKSMSKFGFAIKYSINGKEHNLYKVNNYNNSSLIKL